MDLSVSRKFREAVWTILIGAAGFVLVASPAIAAFDVPDSCRAGSGTYTGDLNGEVTYSTCVVEGVEKISIRFAGDFAKKADYQFATAITYAERTPTDLGEIVVDSNTYTRDAKFTAQFGACGITGSWQLLNNTSGAVEYQGTFDMASTGAGVLCDPNTNAGGAGGGGGSSGGTCGLFGSGGLLMAAPMLLGLRRARRLTSN